MTRLEDPHALADRAPRSHCGARLLGRQGGALFTKHAGRDLLPPLAFTQGWSYLALKRVTEFTITVFRIMNPVSLVFSTCFPAGRLPRCRNLATLPRRPRRRRAALRAPPRSPGTARRGLCRRLAPARCRPSSSSVSFIRATKGLLTFLVC